MRINPITFKIFHKISNKKVQNLNFKGFDCPEDSFEIKKLYDVPCPMCNVYMIKGNQIDNFVQSAQNKTGEELIEVLNKYDKYFHEQEKKVVQDIIQRARISPDENISQIVYNLAKKQLFPLKRQQLKLLNNIKYKAERSSKSSKDELLLFIDRQKKLIYQNENKKFKKETFINGLICLLSDYNDINRKKRILFVASKIKNIPEELKFLDKNWSKSQREILLNLVLPSKITLEHIKPKSKGGENNTSNYLAECSRCNSQRENKPFKKWVEKKPDFRDNFTRYLSVIFKKLNQNELSKDYSTYIEDVISTVSNETSSAIDLKGIKFEKEMPEKTTSATIEDIKSSLEEKKDKLKELSRTNEELKTNEKYRFIINQDKIKQEIELYKTNIVKMKKTLKNKRYNLKGFEWKKQDLENKKQKIKDPLLTKKEKELLEYKIKKLNSYFETNSRENLIQEIQNAQRNLAFEIKRKEELENQLDNEKTAKYVDELREKYTYLKTAEKIEELENEITCIESFIKDWELGNITFDDLLELIGMV